MDYETDQRQRKKKRRFIPEVCIEDELIMGDLGRELAHDLEGDVEFREEESDGMESVDGLINFDVRPFERQDDEESESNEVDDCNGTKPKQRILSKLKPWEKTLPEFVVSHMAHTPCGPKYPHGTCRGCWINGKCKGTHHY